jgi:glycerophosphoryl diester phosphodiesterase
MKRMTVAAVVVACVVTGDLDARADRWEPVRGDRSTVRDAASVIGHRGNPADVYTENTVASMRSAAAAGATAVEFDVRVTADDRFVVMHDVGLGRTTTCEGLVRAKTLDWILQRCRGQRRREPVPALAEVLDWSRSAGVDLLVELKQAPGWDIDRMRDVIAAIERRDLGAHAEFLSFDPNLLELVERVAPAMRTQLIISGSRDPDLAISRFDGVYVDPAEATPDLVSRFHALGMTVYGRNSNNPADWARYWSAGVDGFLTDRPDAADRVLRTL